MNIMKSSNGEIKKCVTQTILIYYIWVRTGNRTGVSFIKCHSFIGSFATKSDVVSGQLIIDVSPSLQVKPFHPDAHEQP